MAQAPEVTVHKYVGVRLYGRAVDYRLLIHGFTREDGIHYLPAGNCTVTKQRGHWVLLNDRSLVRFSA
jgi:hypothetical protein